MTFFALVCLSFYMRYTATREKVYEKHDIHIKSKFLQASALGIEKFII